MQSDNAIGSWKLHHHVCMVLDCLELGEGQPPEDGMIRRFEISYLEGDVLGLEVFPSAECDGQGDLPEWYRRGPVDYPVEQRSALIDLRAWNLHVIQGFSEED